MSDKKPDLLDELITFLETEREIYGPFSVNTATENEQTGTASDAGAEKTTDSDSSHEPVLNTPESTAKTDPSSKSSSSPLSLKEKLKNCGSLDELKKLCESSDQLKTDLKGTNLVFGVGNSNADLMVIGEAPGFNEDKEGEPFVGAAGQLLNKILKAIDFDRQDIYIANILKHRPPDNRNPNSEERERSLPFLERQIDLIAPKVILCVGKVSGTTLLGKDQALKNMRGQFYDYRGAKLTVTYHPAALLRNPKWKRPVWEDVQGVRKLYDELGGTP